MKASLHSFNRRCLNHDYRSRCIYMITMLKSPSAPRFSSITRDPTAAKITPVVEIHPAGGIIYDCLAQLCRDYPELSILRSIVMPDHIHFELFVTRPTQQPLGSMMGAFKSACTSRFNAAFPALLRERESLFEPGFNDKIAFKAGAKNAFYNYIADNPRRYLVKKLCPEYFFHKLTIDVNGRPCGIYGNMFLLDSPIKSCVKISRIPERTPDYASRIREWEETIRSGGVLVSPFINPYEKRFRDAAVANGNGIILIADYLFSDRKKPYKELFSQCAEGKLLIITTEEFPDPPQTMEYRHAQELNAIAAAVAQLAPGEARFRRR